MSSYSHVNPFARRESHSPGSVIAYKILTLLSWVLAVVVSIYYSWTPPQDGIYIRRSIWDQNAWHHSGFTLNPIITSIYWLVLFILQVGYVLHLFSSDLSKVNAACAVGSHFIVHNLLHFAFVMLFTRSYFGWAELMVVLNFINLSSLYFRHNSYPKFIHVPAVSGPLAFYYVALFWVGAISVPHQESLVARIFANIFVWGILAYGLFFILIYKDYTMGFNLSVLSAALGVAQFFRQVIAFQWIFAFTIMAVLFVFTLIVAVPSWSGREFNWYSSSVQPDAERAPLLGDN